MISAPQPLPTDTGLDADELLIVRQLGRLVGPWLDAPQDSLNAADLIAFGSAVYDGSQTTAGSLDEAFVDTASDLLSEWVALYAVLMPPPDAASQRIALLARSRTGFIGHPRIIDTAIRDLAGVDTDVLETLWSEVTALPRNVFVIVVRMNADVYGTPPTYTPTFFQVADVVGRMKPAHVAAVFTGTQTDDFLTDDANSLTDNTVLRA